MNLAKGLGLVLILLVAPRPAPGEDDKTDADPIGGSSSKYNLEYESAKGKQKGEVHYRVRNKPGGILTPMLRKDGKTVLLDCMVPRCPKDADDCDWIETRHTYLDSVRGKTDFSYGLNQDECMDEARAWRKSRDSEEGNGDAKQSIIAT